MLIRMFVRGQRILTMPPHEVKAGYAPDARTQVLTKLPLAVL